MPGARTVEGKGYRTVGQHGEIAGEQRKCGAFFDPSRQDTNALQTVFRGQTDIVGTGVAGSDAQTCAASYPAVVSSTPSNSSIRSFVVEELGPPAALGSAEPAGNCLDDPLGNAALRIDLFPSDRTLPILSLRDRQKLAAEFQPALLAYRLSNIERVAAAQFDHAGVSEEVRPLAGLFAGCIVGAPELQAGVGPLLQTQRNRFRAERWVEPRCVVIEALLSRCHRRQQDGNVVRVAEIAQDVAAILKGRGESLELQPRAIGATMRVLGPIAKRSSQGYGFALTESFSRTVHKLAR